MKKRIREENQLSNDASIYVMSVVATICKIPEWTLRMLDKNGLVCPSRSEGEHRMYSYNDIMKLKRIKEMMNKKINRCGIKRILELEDRIEIMIKKSTK